MGSAIARASNCRWLAAQVIVRIEKTEPRAAETGGTTMRPANLIGLTLGAFAGALIAQQPAVADLKTIEEAAKKEGQLTWYVANVDARNAEIAGRTFTEKYGIKVTVVRAASQIMYQRLAQDLSQNVANADVF